MKKFKISFKGSLILEADGYSEVIYQIESKFNHSNSVKDIIEKIEIIPEEEDEKTK